MFEKRFYVEGLAHASYLFGANGEAAVVDPKRDVDDYIESAAAAGLNLGLPRARHDRVVCVHQDVHLPQGWDRLMLNQYRMAERQFGPIGVAGVYGVGEVIQVSAA